MIMKKIVSVGKFVALVSLLLLGFTILLMTLDGYVDMAYISTRLDTSYQRDASELDQAFRRRFVPGMTIDEVNRTLSGIDPAARTIDGDELECNPSKCCALIYLFERHVRNSWGYTFCFDTTWGLLFVTLFPG